MKRIIATVMLLLFLTSFSWAWLNFSSSGKKINSLYLPKKETVFPLSKENYRKLQARAGEVKNFARINHYNTRICFLIDMSLPSGQNRFFVYDLKDDTIRNAALVTHGRCNQLWLEGRKYGNTVGCGCTSLGKYRIGQAYNGKFGLAFKLFGLDKTNDKAYQRFVVLHAHECVPETEVKDEICQSDGCPTVAPGFLQQLKPIIDRSPRPVLLWVFE